MRIPVSSDRGVSITWLLTWERGLRLSKVGCVWSGLRLVNNVGYVWVTLVILAWVGES